MDVIDTNEVFREDRRQYREYNDCVVRAIAIAFGLSYEHAHQYCATYLQRKHRKGTKTTIMFNGKDHLSSKVIPFAFNKIHLKYCTHPNIIDCTNNSGVGSTGMYLKKFLSKCDSKATYIVLSSGHAYCVKRGQVYGNLKDIRTYVKLAYRLEE